MIIYPAIDLLGGRCVRLRQGDYAQATVFDGDPVEVAQRWRDAGATWLHIVDLDGARVGQPVHLGVVARIAAATGLPLRLGGGLRTRADIAAASDARATRVALGTAALDVALLAELVAKYGERIEVALDRRGDAVALDGWLTDAPQTPAQWARQAVAVGVRSLLVTDIRRDGMLAGANTELVTQTRADVGQAPLAITIAGGVTTVADVRALAQAGADGAVIGQALYAGRITLAEALA
nr:1-(5-phosphoribosyl)-5-[(5-phosphoribosylamino)methylideneamino] imidazole-4-carboxamide isomerase [Ktedonobacterales bacterium]